jgi:EmrB/QacA subfamily drug resistance transporter
MAEEVVADPRVEPSTKGWAALAAMLGGTFLGTLNNNIVNVPLRSIAETFDAPLSRGILVVVSFLLAFSVSMPLAGWLGDRLGRRQVYLWALVGLAVGALGAATAPTLPVLIGFRVVQGLATAAVLPTVMGLIAEIFGPERRARALGVWAAVNGFGQAVGPPLGGFVSAWLGWRWVFVPIVPAALVTVLATLRLVPRDRGRDVPLDVRGATAITLGATLLIAGATVLPLPGVSWPIPAVLSGAGVLALVVFGVLAGRSERPLVARHLMLESRFLRSSLAVFAQMFCLGATLVAVPLYLTGEARLSTKFAGLVVFALPASMAVLAPLSGFLTERLGPRWVARSGLALLVVSQLGVGAYLSNHGHRPAVVAMILAVNGVAVALVQTPVAAGATRSPAGKVGAALGLFNLVRFAGSALGAAWVAIVLPHGAVAVLFATCAGMAVAGLAGTFAGPDPEPMGSRALELSARARTSG